MPTHFRPSITATLNRITIQRIIQSNLLFYKDKLQTKHTIFARPKV